MRDPLQDTLPHQRRSDFHTWAVMELKDNNSSNSLHSLIHGPDVEAFMRTNISETIINYHKSD